MKKKGPVALREEQYLECISICSETTCRGTYCCQFSVYVLQQKGTQLRSVL